MRVQLLAAALAMAVTPALADDERFPPVADETTMKECSACHMAFQPQFLPQRSWQRIMDTLSEHFGEDASLPDDQRNAITAYLVANAGDVSDLESGRKFAGSVAADQTPLRITEVPYWVREHREVKERDWTSPRVKTKANCLACHKGAESGNYEDD